MAARGHLRPVQRAARLPVRRHRHARHARHAWPVPPAEVYDRWDAVDKGLQRDCATWVPFAELSRQAFAATYAELGVTGSSEDDVRALLEAGISAVHVISSLAELPGHLSRIALR